MSPSSRLRDRPYLLLTLTSLFWAGNAVVGRAVVDAHPAGRARRRSAGRWRSWSSCPSSGRRIRAEMPIDPPALRHAGAPRLHQRQRLQHAALLEPAPHDGDQRHADAVDRPAADRAVELRCSSASRSRAVSSAASSSRCSASLTIVSGGDLSRLAQLSLNVGDIAVHRRDRHLRPLFRRCCASGRR